MPTVHNYAKMSATTSAGDVSAEAKRILAMSISKLYASRTQRGGLRLHRSLLLSLVMRTTRDIYHSAYMLACPESGAQSATEEPMDTSPCSGAAATAVDQDELSPSQSALTSAAETAPETPQSAEPSQGEACDKEMTEDKENVSPAAMSPARHNRKRRGKASVAPDFLPSKRARLEPGEERHALALGEGAAGIGNCRAWESLTTISPNRIITAF